MNPDDEQHALWLEDELDGPALEAMERRMATCPEQLAARDDVRQWKRFMAAALPSEAEPPYRELFDARISRKIRETQQESPQASIPPQAVIGPSHWFTRRRWLMPLASCAGRLLAFWLGTRQAGSTSSSAVHLPQARDPSNAAAADAIDVSGAPRALPVDAAVYAPDGAVSVEWITGTSASVIVLNGMQPIPDETDFSQTAASGQIREVDLTAGLEP